MSKRARWQRAGAIKLLDEAIAAAIGLPAATVSGPEGTVNRGAASGAAGAAEVVRVFDPATMQPDPARVVKVGGVAMFADFSPDGQWLYVPHQGDDHVSAINTKTLELRDLALPKQACLAAHALRVLSPQTAAVVCEGDHISRKGTVVMLDLTSWSVRGFVEVGLFPDGLTRLPAL